MLTVVGTVIEVMRIKVGIQWNVFDQRMCLCRYVVMVFWYSYRLINLPSYLLYFIKSSYGASIVLELR